MYTVNERPILEVELSADSRTYLKNIDLIISEQYIDRVIIRSKEKTERIKEYLQLLIEKYKNKEFYLCNLFDMNMQYQNVINCFDFTIDSIGEKSACNVGILHIDLSEIDSKFCYQMSYLRALCILMVIILCQDWIIRSGLIV